MPTNNIIKLSGKYGEFVTIDGGGREKICSIDMDESELIDLPTHKAKAYPNPAHEGEEITIELINYEDNEYEDCVIKIVNSNGDKLYVRGHDGSCSIGGEHPYMLPVEARVGEYILPCTNISFMRFLGDAMPQGMLLRHNFSNVDVLLKCLRYLTHPREEWWEW